MAKAETGTGGAVVAELAYRNDYIAVRGQQRLAEEAWQRNKCRETGRCGHAASAARRAGATAPPIARRKALSAPLPRRGFAWQLGAI